MPAKTQIVDFLGDKTLVLPALLDAAIVGNERAKYVLSLFQMAASYAEHQQEGGAPSLRTDREACGIVDATFDRSVAESVSDGHGNFHIPGARRLMAILDDGMNAMLAPLALLASNAKESSALYGQCRQRLDQILKAQPTIVDDMMSSETIASMTSGRPASGDGFHLLIMDLHKEVNRLQSQISTEVVEGAKAYGITEADRLLITRFMTGLYRTAALKFDHPGLATTAARSGSTLLIPKRSWHN